MPLTPAIMPQPGRAADGERSLAVSHPGRRGNTQACIRNLFGSSEPTLTSQNGRSAGYGRSHARTLFSLTVTVTLGVAGMGREKREK
jgi:hypothetical protein